jgi:hypothetical protein
MFLPPRVFGEASTPPETANDIATAFRVVFGSTSDEASQVEHVEGGREMVDLLAEAASRVPGTTVATRVERIRFLDSHTADVRFQIGLGGGPHGPLFEGRAIEKEGSWLVSKDTVLRVLSISGVPRRLGPA